MAAAKTQTGNDVVITTTVELIGVALLSLLAGANNNLGSVIVIVMVGFLIGWLLMNSSELTKIIPGSKN
jgi:uncharacterized membrane protein